MSLTTALKLAAAPVVLVLAGCVTNPTSQGSSPQSGAAPQDNTPRAMATTQTAAPAAVAAGTIKWNDEDCLTKNLTVGAAKAAVSGSETACARITVEGVAIPKAAATRAGTAAQAASTARKNTQGTKNAAQAKADAAPVAAAAVGPVPEAIILTTRLSASACGASSGNALQAVADGAKSAWDTVGGFLGKRVEQVASSSVGGGVPGNIAGRAAKDATASANTQATTTAKGAAAPMTEAAINCNKQLTELSNGAFKTGLDKFLTEWKASNTGYVPKVTFESELPAAQEAIFKAVVNTSAPAAAAPAGPRR